jgi:hypothetical protein
MSRALRRRYGRSGARPYAVGDLVTLPKGYKIGMGRLREPVQARVTQVQISSEGTPFYGLEWLCPRTGKRRTTWWAP